MRWTGKTVQQIRRPVEHDAETWIRGTLEKKTFHATEEGRMPISGKRIRDGRTREDGGLSFRVN